MTANSDPNRFWDWFRVADDTFRITWARMSHMRLMLCVLAVVLCASTALDSQNTGGIPVVHANGPTVIAMFPNGSKMGASDADGSEALSDFQYYAMRVKKPLTQLGVQFTEEYGRSFRIRSGVHGATFTRNNGTPAYYFFSPGRKPRIVYGVRTDSDFLALARQYFTDQEN